MVRNKTKTSPLQSGSHLLHYRLWLVVAATLYPAWSILIYLFLPAFDDPVARLVIMAVFYGICGLSFVSGFVKRHIRWFVLGAAFLFQGHFYYLCYLDGWSDLYLTANTAVVGVLCAGFLERRFLCLYTGLNVLTLFVIGYLFHMPIDRLTYVVGYPCTIHILFIITLFQKTRVEDQVSRLISSILPETIADRLRGSGDFNLAENFENVGVMFADIVGFTASSVQQSPQDTLALLDQIFTRLDRIVEKHGAEKIKSIGDCLMVATGVPVRRDDNLEVILSLALDIKTDIENFAAETGLPLSMRIGISAGPVIAGIIGTKRVNYDIWGHTVNLASRMESSAKAGTIQIPQEVAVKAVGFKFAEPRTIEVKGIGVVQVCTLIRRKSKPFLEKLRA